MKDALSSSETSVLTRATWRNIPEDTILHGVITFMSTSILTCRVHVVGAASSQEQLAVAAQNAVSTIVQLAEVVKFGAASLGSNNPEAQVSRVYG
jgi:hypothetical protein